jgi:hypothetical protein
VRCAPLPHTTNAKGTLRRYKKLGYSSGTARAYQNHWRRKIGHLISGMLDQMELRRCMTEVRLHFPNIENEVAFIALAEAKGSAEEACAKLSESGFVLEAQLAAAVIDLDPYVRKGMSGELGDGSLVDEQVRAKPRSLQ